MWLFPPLFFFPYRSGRHTFMHGNWVSLNLFQQSCRELWKCAAWRNTWKLWRPNKASFRLLRELCNASQVQRTILPIDNALMNIQAKFTSVHPAQGLQFHSGPLAHFVNFCIHFSCLLRCSNNQDCYWPSFFIHCDKAVPLAEVGNEMS